MNWSIILASACGIAVAQGFFLGSLLIAKDKRQFGAYFFWGLTIFAVSIRISKSLVYYFLPDMSLWGVAIGGAGLWAIGPSMWLSLQAKSDKPNGLKNYFHFLPTIFLLFSGAFLGWSEMKFVYTLGTTQLLIYLTMSIVQVVKNKSLNTKVIKTLLTSVVLIGLAFVFQLVTSGIQFYAIGAIVASLVLYVINFVITSDIQKTKTKQTSGLSAIKRETLENVVEKVQILFKDEQVYREPKLTLNKLAYKINQPVYIVRQAIIQIEKKNFNDYVNSFRIEEVKKLLEQGNLQYTIEGMAYDVGFSSVSSFYEAFKKITKCTPVEYKKTITTT